MDIPLKMTGRWDQVKGIVKETWGEITDDDFRKADGKIDRLVGIIEERTGVSKEKILEKLGPLAKRF